jgi:ABC-2 type transport system permease protein
MALGFFRDRTALFFTVLFPLMFLVLFGGIFANPTAPKVTVLEVGAVPLIDGIPSADRVQLDQAVKFSRDDNLEDALSQVRKGDVDAAVQESGGELLLHYSMADQVKAGAVQEIFSSLVDSGNLAAAGAQPTYALQAQQVEDQSLKTIQYITPGLLGWAVATGATFGAALTLITWRQKKILRRLRLSPVRTSSIIGARVGVSVIIGLVQTAIFLAIASIPYFGLKLSAWWWMAIPLVIAGTLAFLAVGLLAGSFSKTPEAGSAVANLIVLPMAFLSGAFIPLEAAPAWLVTISKFLPMGYLVEGMKDVMVRGEGPSAAFLPMVILLAFAAVVTFIATRVFRWDTA